MVTTRHAAGASPPPATPAARRSTRKARAVSSNARAETPTVETAKGASTSTAAAGRQQDNTQHKTLQHLASMLWQALDNEEADSTSDDEADTQPTQSMHNNDDNTMLTWAPTLSLDDAPLLPSATTMRKEPGLAAQPRVLPSTSRTDKPSTPRWTALPAQEIDDQVKRDLRLLRLRAAYDPTRHYKAWGKGKFPKHFAFGTVIEGPGEFFTERLTRKERKRTLAEQLLADEELTAARTKRFAKMQEEASRWSLRKNKRQRQAEPPRKHRGRPKH